MRRFGIGAMGAMLACVLALSAPAVAENFPGTSGDDTLVGTQENDDIFGKAGNDTLRGRGRIDLLVGGPGDDVLQGGDGFDELDAGRGDDTIKAREGNLDPSQGNRDQIDCGPGTDIAIVDHTEDGIFDCEDIRIGGSG